MVALFLIDIFILLLYLLINSILIVLVYLTNFSQNNLKDFFESFLEINIGYIAFIILFKKKITKKYELHYVFHQIARFFALITSIPGIVILYIKSDNISFEKRDYLKISIFVLGILLNIFIILSMIFEIFTGSQVIDQEGSLKSYSVNEMVPVLPKEIVEAI